MCVCGGRASSVDGEQVEAATARRRRRSGGPESTAGAGGGGAEGGSGPAAEGGSGPERTGGRGRRRKAGRGWRSGEPGLDGEQAAAALMAAAVAGGGGAGEAQLTLASACECGSCDECGWSEGHGASCLLVFFFLPVAFCVNMTQRHV